MRSFALKCGNLPTKEIIMLNVIKRSIGAVMVMVMLFAMLTSFTACDNIFGKDGQDDTNGGASQDSGTSQDTGTTGGENPGGDDTPEPPAETRTPAPDFTIYDADGNEVKLSDFLGTPVVLNFWATWCPPCKAEMPHFQTAYVKYGYKIQFLMVNTGGETVSVVENFINKKGYSFPVFYDTNYDAAETYGISGIPTTFFITADGYISSYVIGSIAGDALNQEIAKIR